MGKFETWMQDLEKVAFGKGFLPDATFKPPHLHPVWKPRFDKGMTPEEAWDFDTACIESSKKAQEASWKS